jgi:prepilin peptidase CpaA
MAVDRLLPFVPLMAALFWAAVQDLRMRRIRNWLTFSLLLTGVAQSFLPGRTVSPGESALGLLAGFALPMLLFVIGALGAGDVKLLTAIGAWLGAAGILQVFAVEAVLGMLLVLTQAALTGRLRTLLRNSAVLAINLRHVGDVGLEHVTATGRSCRSVDRPLPFAVPVFAATLIVVYVSVCGGRL